MAIINDVDGLNNYEKKDGSDIAIPSGVNTPEQRSKLTGGQITNSVINKLHLIKLANDYPFAEKDIPNKKELFVPRTVIDLCKMNVRSMAYDIDDFLYCKNVGMPINHLITLRRFPYPCTDNIWDKETQGEPDIARIVTYFTQETNKLDELLAYSYKLKWKELTSEYESASMQGEQSGLSGFMKSAMKVIDPELWKNDLRGENGRMYDPKHDQNKVYGPVDSVNNTHIRDVGFEFTKDFDITFEYELRSEDGRTPEYVIKDIIANILAVTYNNGKFWPGARYWIGERPSKFYQRFQYMNTTDIDNIVSSGIKDLKSVFTNFSTKSSAIDTLKAAITGGLGLALGKILDKVGRPGILTMNSLLSGEPTGFWHLTIGNPVNPLLCVGNLICDGVEFNFPTDTLSYGDFPTKLQVKIKLKPAQIKDRAGIEMMFNAGKHRIYYAPKKVTTITDSANISNKARKFFGFDEREIDNLLSQTFDFISDGVKTVSTTVKEVSVKVAEETSDTASKVNVSQVFKGKN